jgi:hypothetical protein
MHYCTLQLPSIHKSIHTFIHPSTHIHSSRNHVYHRLASHRLALDSLGSHNKRAKPLLTRKDRRRRRFRDRRDLGTRGAGDREDGWERHTKSRSQNESSNPLLARKDRRRQRFGDRRDLGTRGAGDREDGWERHTNARKAGGRREQSVNVETLVSTHNMLLGTSTRTAEKRGVLLERGNKE